MNHTRKGYEKRHGLPLELRNWLESEAGSNTLTHQKMLSILPDALDDLITQKQREILLLYFQGHKMVDIGKKLNLHESTVSRTISRAIKRLELLKYALDPLDESRVTPTSIDTILRSAAEVLNQHDSRRKETILCLISNNFDLDITGQKMGLKKESVHHYYKKILDEINYAIHKNCRKNTDVPCNVQDYVCSNLCKYPAICKTAAALSRYCNRCPLENL